MLLFIAYPSIHDSIYPYVGHISFPQLLGIVILFFLILGLFDYKFAHPARVGFGNEQAKKHNSWVWEEFNKIKCQNKKIETNLNEFIAEYRNDKKNNTIH
jgi:hypothetical protein